MPTPRPIFAPSGKPPDGGEGELVELVGAGVDAKFVGVEVFLDTADPGADDVLKVA
jgi:hypothetical protein